MDRIIWANDFENNMNEDNYNDVRYLKFILSHRLVYLSDKFGLDNSIEPEDVSTNEVHKLTLNMPDGSTETMDVIDGTLLTQDDLPEIRGDGVWCFDFYVGPEG